MTRSKHGFGPHLLCVAPPYGTRVPAGVAYLLGYLEAHGCHDFDFVDMRLGAPFDFTPTYRTTGVFGESFVIDVPDLPLVLHVLEALRDDRALAPAHDAVFERYCFDRAISPSYLHAYLQSMERYLEHCIAQLSEVRFIGFSVWSTNYLFTLMAAAILKRRDPSVVVVAGGPQVTSSRSAAALALRSGLVDVVALGDGEQTLLELYQRFQSTPDDLHGVPGTLTLDPATKTIREVSRKRVRMKQITRPSFDRMPVHAYQLEPDTRALPLQFSRGCTDKCSFCSEWVFWERFRPDAPENTVDYILDLERRYGCNFIDFSDSLLNGIPRRLVALAETMLSRSTSAGWTAFMRAEMDLETAKLLSRAGCSGVFIGVESFSDEALARMNKRRTEADNIRAIRSFLEAGIYVTAGFIPGFPGDSREGFMHSVSVVRQLQEQYPTQLELHEEPFTVMANAPIYHRLGEHGLSPVMWDDEFLDLAPAYRDITETIVCHVSGAGQGLERIGRMALVGAIKSDGPVAGTFQDGQDDDLPVGQFGFDHLLGDWYCARIKTANGHRYSLLVSTEEVESLSAHQAEHYPITDLSERRLARLLAPIERAHLRPPPRRRQPIQRGFYTRGEHAETRYSISPFLVARNLGSKHRNQVLLLNSLHLHTIQRSQVFERVLAAIGNRTLTPKQVWKRMGGADASVTLARVERACEDLYEEGVLIADRASPAAAPSLADMGAPAPATSPALTSLPLSAPSLIPLSSLRARADDRS